jgi:proliferating cell nuclear antigen PCNA
MSSNQTPEVNYIFKAKTKEAFVIKILSELLSHTIKFAPFRIDHEGIHLSQADMNYSQLINFTLHKENFQSYKYTHQLNFMVNSSHLYRMLKAIKKKDYITLFIREDDNTRLGICVETTDENNKTNTFIRITYNQPEVYRDPMGYENPTITTAKEFQKMKNLHNISKNMIITSPHPGFIKFFCDGGEVFSREVAIGSDERDEDEQSEEIEEYRQVFTTSHITQLTKCAGQSGNVQIFVQHDLPLKIKMKAGNLGDLTVFIKSREQIELEHKMEAEKKKMIDDE